MTSYPPAERCTRYDVKIGRQCQNKRFQGHLCRKHVIEDLKRYEQENFRLVWYLDNVHLLRAQESARATASGSPKGNSG